MFLNLSDDIKKDPEKYIVYLCENVFYPVKESKKYAEDWIAFVSTLESETFDFNKLKKEIRKYDFYEEINREAYKLIRSKYLKIYNL